MFRPADGEGGGGEMNGFMVQDGRGNDMGMGWARIYPSSAQHPIPLNATRSQMRFSAGGVDDERDGHEAHGASRSSKRRAKRFRFRRHTTATALTHLVPAFLSKRVPVSLYTDQQRPVARDWICSVTRTGGVVVNATDRLCPCCSLLRY